MFFYYPINHFPTSYTPLPFVRTRISRIYTNRHDSYNNGKKEPSKAASTPVAPSVP